MPNSKSQPLICPNSGICQHLAWFECVHRPIWGDPLALRQDGSIYVCLNTGEAPRRRPQGTGGASPPAARRAAVCSLLLLAHLLPLRASAALSWSACCRRRVLACPACACRAIAALSCRSARYCFIPPLIPTACSSSGGRCDTPVHLATAPLCGSWPQISQTCHIKSRRTALLISLLFIFCIHLQARHPVRPPASAPHRANDPTAGACPGPLPIHVSI